MNFTRNLFATMLIAAFGAIVSAGGTSSALTGTPPAAGTAIAFGYVFLVAAASLSVALIAVLLMEEKPLRTDAEMGSP